jgi:DNA polymerase-3 subunit chi
LASEPLDTSPKDLNVPAVAFHFNVPEPRDYCCRLLRKADRQGARLAVHGPAQTLADLDRLLWQFDPLEFVPHWRGGRLDNLPQRLAATPVVLLEHLDAATVAPRYPVLVNLAVDVPPGVAVFDRIIEVVGLGPELREAARQRWRWYASQQWTIERHEVKSI